jgi:MFS family permease
MLSKILKDSGFGNLGFYSLGLYYLAFGFAGFFSSPVITKCGDKRVLALGALAYTINTAAQILPVLLNEHPDNEALNDLKGLIYGLLIVTAIVNGLGAGLYWVA